MTLDLNSSPLLLTWLVCVRSVTQSCPTLCDPMNCRLPGSSVHGIFQAGILEWVTISSSRGSSQPRDRTCVSCVGRQILYHLTTWEAPLALQALSSCHIGWTASVPIPGSFLTVTEALLLGVTVYTILWICGPCRPRVHLISRAEPVT